MDTVTSSESVVVRIADRLARSVGTHRYSMWFDRSARLNYDQEQRRLEVKVPNRFVADWIGRNFHHQLREAAEHELGDQVDLNVHVDEALFSAGSNAASPTSARNNIAQTGDRPSRPPTPASTGTSKSCRGRSLRHQLEQFIVGPSNELAYAAASGLADQVAEQVPGAGPDREGDSRNVHTLFIHGGCGLGKTHLLQGICRRVLDRRTSARVRYTTAEQFTNEFLATMRVNRVDRFRDRIRHLDLLVVDDVHFLAGKQATQQEFLHSFDAIDLGGAHVVMASDSHPKMIHKLSEGLVSRCVRGMVVQVTVPDTATRIRIVRALAARRGLSILDSVIEVLASRWHGSVREIEGTLTKLHALLHLVNERCDRDPGVDTIGHALLNRLFEAEPQDRPPKVVRFEAILQTVADQLQVGPGQIVGRSRRRPVVQARSMVVYLAREMTSMSYPEIATAMGRSSHSTVITAVRRVEGRLVDDTPVRSAVHLEPMRTSELVERLKHEILKA